MKTDVIGVRLPVEQVAKLQKMASSRGMKVSDLVREMVKVGIEGAEASADLTVQLLARMKQLEENLEGGQTWLADVVITQMKAVAAARYLAQIAADNTDEVISYLANQKPLDTATKEQWRKKREEEQARQGQQWVDKALEIARQESPSNGSWD